MGMLNNTEIIVSIPLDKIITLEKCKTNPLINQNFE